jgi:hypothetical protein
VDFDISWENYMGGFGSGRPATWSGTVEDSRALDINKLNKRGCLEPGWSGLWTWATSSGQTASIGMSADDACIHLSFRAKPIGGQWRQVEQSIEIEWVDCHFGGARPLFICPGGCSKAAAKLYGSQELFLCRQCSYLTYQSQRENEQDRAFRRMNKLRARAGAEPGLAAPYPSRPKGRWRRTHRRLVTEAQAVERELLGRLRREL